MLGHISFGVSNLSQSIAFYDATMKALGYACVFTSSTLAGYGLPGTTNDRLLLIQKPKPIVPPGAGFHLAFAAPSQEAVDRFHIAALQNGGTDEGPPGPRPQYGQNYYAAFVLDPDGHKLEAKHSPPETI